MNQPTHLLSLTEAKTKYRLDEEDLQELECVQKVNMYRRSTYVTLYNVDDIIEVFKRKYEVEDHEELLEQWKEQAAERRNQNALIRQQKQQARLQKLLTNLLLDRVSAHPYYIELFESTKALPTIAVLRETFERIHANWRLIDEVITAEDWLEIQPEIDAGQFVSRDTLSFQLPHQVREQVNEIKQYIQRKVELRESLQAAGLQLRADKRLGL
jgi:hypothetical protein